MRGGPEEPAPTADAELAHLWQKPTCEELLACLARLRLEPPVWNLKISRAEILQKQQQQKQHIVDSREIISYLSAIIKSTLGWIDDYDEKELVWEEASKRLTERCGRTGNVPSRSRHTITCQQNSVTDKYDSSAMGEIVRRWPFENPSFSLTIREPPLTGDSLGLKTWGSSYVLAQLLPVFSAGPLAHLIPSPESNINPVDILELGSGTGLLGLSAACTWGANVVLTDLPEILPNLAHNTSLNLSTIEACGGRAEAAALTWGGGEDDSDPRFARGHSYKVSSI